MHQFVLRAVAGVCLCASFLFAASSRDRAGLYERIVCVVPMVGAGTVQDPKRPLFTRPSDLGIADVTNQGSPEKRKHSDIAAFQSVSTDDGQAAIVVFVAHRYSAFKPILSSSRVIRSFERKNISERELTAQLRKYKHDFSIEMLRVGAL